MDPVAILKRQHREVEQLFQRTQKTNEPDERRRLCLEIVDRLTLHTRLEEEIFYPAIRELPAKKAHEMIDEAFEEHHVVKLVLAELPEVDPDDERFHAKVTVLSELVQHHVEEEEQEMFKLAQKIGGDELEQIGDRLQAELGPEGSDGADSRRPRAGAQSRSSRGATPRQSRGRARAGRRRQAAAASQR